MLDGCRPPANESTSDSATWKRSGAEGEERRMEWKRKKLEI